MLSRYVSRLLPLPPRAGCIPQLYFFFVLTTQKMYKLTFHEVIWPALVHVYGWRLDAGSRPNDW